MSTELENFRKKYPQYGDMSDADLANSLASKYPEAYGDLPGKISQSHSPDQDTDPAPTPEPEPIPLDLGDDRNLDWKDAILQGVQNAPESAGRIAMDMFNAVMSPIDTIFSAIDLLAGAIGKALPGEPTPNDKQFEDKIDLMADYYKDRYGSVEGFKQAIAEDPAGVLADGSSFMIPGGVALRGIGTGAKVNTLTKLGQIATSTGTMIDPFNIGAKAARTGARAVIPKQLPKNMYRRALKFGTNNPQLLDKLTQTGLTEGIMPSKAGLEKLRTQINIRGKRIDDMIDIAEAQGKEVRIADIVSEVESMPLEALDAADARTIKRVTDDFLNQQAFGKDRLTIPPSEAQSLKKRYNKKLKSAHSKISAKPASVEAKLAINRGLRKSLETLVPEIKNMNLDLKSLIELKDMMEGKVGSMSKADLANYGDLAKIRTGGVIGGPAGAISAFTLGLISGPKIGAKLAKVLYDIERKGIKLSPETTQFRNMLLTDLRTEEN